MVVPPKVTQAIKVAMLSVMEPKTFFVILLDYVIVMVKLRRVCIAKFVSESK